MGGTEILSLLSFAMESNTSALRGLGGCGEQGEAWKERDRERGLRERWRLLCLFKGTPGPAWRPHGGSLSRAKGLVLLLEAN